MQKILMGLGFVVIVGYLTMRPAMANGVPQVGQPAPALNVKDQNGVLQSLENYQGKWLVVYFYPKDETPGCTSEACAYRDDIHKIQQLGAAVVGVSIDDASSHAEFAEHHHLPFPLLADEDGALANRYGSVRRLLGYQLARRNTFIVDPQGKIAKVYLDVDAEENPAEVLAALKQLQSVH